MWLLTVDSKSSNPQINLFNYGIIDYKFVDTSDITLENLSN